MNGYLPWDVPHTGAGNEHKEERAAETKCYEQTAAPIPHTPALLEGERCREVGSEAEPQKNAGAGERCF